MKYELTIEQKYNRITIPNLSFEKISEFIACFDEHFYGGISLTIKMDNAMMIRDEEEEE